ncbi:ribosomal protein S18 acetylase RimI-like enzyme [Deinococcus metalli]|uniref:N-acetyltransferase n=1 Tax=Deinococcus metalli TaxID=1141878 RepID=A0A7W8NLD4_9DEIO|nr:GNAT family N-acetyltransferase [Deinococcus metalli]MBB5374614.1 ribosomal protein S18 acetylase RimI-like enzyme [Deinococcus metalli]GHF35004.1 N-acetyltransferase [Deinococcus metalli]
MSDARIAPLTADTHTLDQLTALLVETVAHGGSVSFMHPLPPEQARAFWQGSLDAARAGGRVLYGAWDGDTLASTVTLLLDVPPNQPHRAEIAKMMTRSAYRGRGLATALLRAAEAEATRRGRTLLVLDTSVDGGASKLYEGAGYILVGEIPDYALTPDGRLNGTLIYYKRLPAQT